MAELPQEFEGQRRQEFLPQRRVDRDGFMEVKFQGLRELQKGARSFLGKIDGFFQGNVGRQGESVFFQKRRSHYLEGFVVQILKIMGVEPEELFLIEDASRSPDVFKRKLLDEFVAAEDLLIPVRPPDAGEEIHEGVGQESHFPVSQDGGRSVSFREACLIRP